MTFIEVLFVSSILALFMGLVGRAIVMGYRAHRKTVERTFATRQATVALSRMIREISTCYTWQAPPPGSPVKHPVAWGDVWWERTAPPGQPLAKVYYYLNTATQELWRRDPAGKERVVARSIEDFTVQVDALPSYVTVSLKVKDNAIPLQVVIHPQSM
ncbi:MAG: hypothetical protein U0931_18725 [Vulcanimicrobiota bacterium]